MSRFVIALVLCSFLVSVAPAQVGVWGGYQYTPRSFPRAYRCNCEMCQSLRQQWSQSTPRATTVPVAAAPAVPESREYPNTWTEGGRKYTLAHGRKYVAESVQVPEIKTEYVKRCVNGVCRLEPVMKTVMVSKFEWKPVGIQAKPLESKEGEDLRATIQAILAESGDWSPKGPVKPAKDASEITELKSTPHEAIEAILDFLPNKGGMFVDLGCGDGRVIEAAAKRGYRALGVELDKDRAEATRERLSSKAFVMQGDVRDVDVSRADVVYMWLYSDLMAQIKIPDTATVVSYCHSYPGAAKVELAGKHVFYIRRGKR